MTEVQTCALPISARIEELIHELKGRYAIVIVTHNMQQAARVSQRTAFFHLGTLVEYGSTSDIFTNPREDRTKDYITGRSEEHTSELQSLMRTSYAVFSLKKKRNTKRKLKETELS